MKDLKITQGNRKPMVTDKQRLKYILKSRGLTYSKIANITGHTPNSIKDMLQPNKPIPRWCKLIVYLYG